MATINIYENSNGEWDLTEIQNTLKQILSENRELKNKLVNIEDKLQYLNNNKDNTKDIVKENKETITKVLETSEETSSSENTNIQVDNKTKLDYSKHHLTAFQSKLLNEIPIVEDGQKYEDEMRKKYASLKPSDRRALLKNNCTISSLMSKFGVERNSIISAIFPNNKPKGDFFYAFKINKDNPKSTQVLYRVKKLPKVKRDYSRKNKEAKWKITMESAKEKYHNLRLKPHFGVKYDSKDGKRTYDLYYDMFDIFYIKSLLSSNNFTNRDFDNLLNHNKHQWTVKNLSQIIYNICENHTLQKLIIETRKFFTTNNTFDESNGMLKINDVNTHISVEQAKEWCIAYMNNGKKKDEFIWNLQRRFPEIKREFITMIIYNHNNSDLYELWKEEEKPIFIENNPSKRRNIIRSGGIV